jgi:hypothetical protein
MSFSLVQQTQLAAQQWRAGTGIGAIGVWVVATFLVTFLFSPVCLCRHW